MEQNKLDEAIKHGKEMLSVFGGEHAEFINVAIECIDKQIPMKATSIVYDDERIVYWNCPYCGIQHSGKELQNFCDKCGQAIDWSDGNG